MPTRSALACGCDHFPRFPCVARATQEDLFCDACRPDSVLRPYLHWQPLWETRDPNGVRAVTDEPHRTVSVRDDPTAQFLMKRMYDGLRDLEARYPHHYRTRDSLTFHLTPIKIH